MNMGQMARSAGWFSRARRLVDELNEPCAVEGLLLLPVALGMLYGGDPGGALRIFSQVADFGENFQDRDLAALPPP